MNHPSVWETVTEAETFGFRFRLEGDRVRASLPDGDQGRLTELLERLRSNREQVAEVLRKRAAVPPMPPRTSLYQQRPASAEGVVLKREWWQFYRPPLALPLIRTVQSWDTAFKKGAENDFSVCTTWGAADCGYYLLHMWRGRVEFPELKRMLASLAEQWKPDAILVEDRASGQSLIQELRLGNSLPVLPVKVDSDKLARAQAVTPLVEAGRVFLPESTPWLGDFVDELAAFPNSVHDDIVDSTTQALNYLREQSMSPPLFLSSRANSAEFDREALWEKAMLGIPLTEKEIDRL